MAFETQSSAPRTEDTSGDIQQIKTFSENVDGSGEQIQAIALTGAEGAKAGVVGLPLYVQSATLASEAKLELVRALLASLEIELQGKADLDETQPVKEQVGLVIDEYDYLDCTHVAGNLTAVVYKDGGAGGATVATLALTYDGDGNLDTVTKT